MFLLSCLILIVTLYDTNLRATSITTQYHEDIRLDPYLNCIYNQCYFIQYNRWTYMRIELMVNKNNVPEDTFYQVESEFTRRMAISWPDALVRVRLGGANELSVLGGLKEDKQHVELELEAMFDEADDWLEQPNYDM